MVSIVFESRLSIASFQAGGAWYPVFGTRIKYQGLGANPCRMLGTSSKFDALGYHSVSNEIARLGTPKCRLPGLGDVRIAGERVRLWPYQATQHEIESRPSASKVFD